MLCVPVLLHRDVVVEALREEANLFLPPPRIEGEPEPLVPCLLQWVNRHDTPFSAADKKSGVMLAQLVSRAGQARRTQQAAEQLQARTLARLSRVGPRCWPRACLA